VAILANLWLAQAQTVAAAFLGAALWGLQMGMTQGLLAAMVADAAPLEKRGTAFGAYHLLSGIALFPASLLAGWLWQVYGPAATFQAGAAIVALAFLGTMLRR
jgi:MFS family permease